MGEEQPPVGAVVDTNVIAYYLLQTRPFVSEVRRFWRNVGPVCAPANWEAELSNVLWLAAGAGVIDLPGGFKRLRLARGLNIETIPVRDLWEGALARSIGAGHPAYDTLFVELAVRRGLKLATFDRAVLRKFPEVATRPRGFPYDE